MGTALAALRDATFGRKIINFALSTYAIVVVIAAFFTPGGLRDGTLHPAVKGHEHIVTFIRWVGLPDAAGWLETKVLDPMVSHPAAVGNVGATLMLLAVGLLCLQKPSLHTIPAQPAYGVVLGAALTVDFGGTNVWLAGASAVLAVFGGLFVFGQEEGTPWDGERAVIPLVQASAGLAAALLSAPLSVLSLITIAPTSPPARVEITSLPRKR